MTKRNMGCLIAILLFPILLIGGFLLYLKNVDEENQPCIVDYHPVNFTEKAAYKFFYSIGDELKYSDFIDPNAKTLFKGKIYDAFVSPDKSKVLIVSEGTLYLVNAQTGSAEKIIEVKSIYGDNRENKPIGEYFFRYTDIQWAQDSKSFYLIKDKYYKTNSQLFSIYGELYNYNIETKEFKKIISPFSACSYSINSDGKRIYFRESDGKGNGHLKCFSNGKTYGTVTTENNEFSVTIDGKVYYDRPFYSLENYEYKDFYLPDKKVGFVLDEMNELLLYLKCDGKTLLTIKGGYGFKGRTFGYNPNNLLPGDSYFLFDVYNANFHGQLLINTKTGKYKTLPKDTKVYLKANINDLGNYNLSRLFY